MKAGVMKAERGWPKKTHSGIEKSGRINNH